MRRNYSGLRISGCEVHFLSIVSGVLVVCGLATIGAIGAILLPGESGTNVAQRQEQLPQPRTFKILPPQAMAQARLAGESSKLLPAERQFGTRAVAYSSRVKESPADKQVERIVTAEKKQWKMAPPPKNVFRLETLRVRQ